MLKLIRLPAAAILRLIGYGMSLARLAPRVGLWRTVWKLGNNPEDGANYLATAARKYGIEHAREIYPDMLARCPDSRIALMMGWLEIHYSGDQAQAARIIEQARRDGLARDQLLLQLDLYLCGNDEQRAQQVAQQILDRRDMPMEVTRSALWSRGWSLAQDGKFDEVEKIADRILAVEEHYEGRILKWMALQSAGLGSAADKQLVLARQTMPAEIFPVLVGQGWLIMGREDMAEQFLDIHRKEDNQ